MEAVALRGFAPLVHTQESLKFSAQSNLTPVQQVRALPHTRGLAPSNFAALSSPLLTLTHWSPLLTLTLYFTNQRRTYASWSLYTPIGIYMGG